MVPSGNDFFFVLKKTRGGQKFVTGGEGLIVPGGCFGKGKGTKGGAAGLKKRLWGGPEGRGGGPQHPPPPGGGPGPGAPGCGWVCCP